MSKNTTKNLGAYFKGQSPCFYNVPSETVVVVLVNRFPTKREWCTRALWVMLTTNRVK